MSTRPQCRKSSRLTRMTTFIRNVEYPEEQPNRRTHKVSYRVDA